MKKILCITAGLLLTAGAAFAQSAGSIDTTSMDKIDSMIEQSSGSYPPIDTGMMTSRGMLQKAWSDPMKNMGEGQTKPGYTRYVWSSDMVLPVRLRESMATLINFPSWEVIDSIWIGDTTSFVGEFPTPNSLLLFTQPGMIGVDSNLIVFGRSGNRYAFYIRSEAYNTDRITNSVVDVVVPNSPSGSSTGGVSSGSSASSSVPYWASGRRGASGAPGDSLNPSAGLNVASNAPKNWLEGIPMNPEEFKFDIEIYVPNPNDISIAPERVWHDNIFTYIESASNSRLLNSGNSLRKFNNMRGMLELVEYKYTTPAIPTVSSEWENYYSNIMNVSLPKGQSLQDNPAFISFWELSNKAAREYRKERWKVGYQFLMDAYHNEKFGPIPNRSDRLWPDQKKRALQPVPTSASNLPPSWPASLAKK